jgi:hypothetical protein
LRPHRRRPWTRPGCATSLLARALFKAMDLAYGRHRTLAKFTMLEFIARVPYRA